MASVTQQALLGTGGTAVAGRPGWYWPLSLVPDTPIWRDHSLFSDSAWLAAIQYAASVVPKSTTWQPQLSLPNYLFTRNRRLLAAMADGSSYAGGWLSSAGIVPAATPAFIGWQQELSVSRVTKHPIWADESSYDGVAWFQAASVISPAAAFLARTSGLDATHIAAYTALINGLVSDGVWSKLDMLHIYATQDSTTALLNLVSTSYNGTTHGLPSFSVDLGFTGVAGSTTVYIDTTFNPFTAVSPQYQLASAHISAWSVSNVGTDDHPIMGAVIGPPTHEISIFPKDSGNNAQFRINDAGVGVAAAVADPVGHYIANKSSSSNLQGYKNGSSLVATTSDTSASIFNQNFYTLAYSVFSSAFGSKHQCGAASIGSSLSAGDATNFYNRLRTYMTAVGVP